jgi:hypothetical protein
MTASAPEPAPTAYPAAWHRPWMPPLEPDPEPEVEPAMGMILAASAMDDETWEKFVKAARGGRSR